jgi:hypothetical protein
MSSVLVNAKAAVPWDGEAFALGWVPQIPQLVVLVPAVTAALVGTPALPALVLVQRGNVMWPLFFLSTVTFSKATATVQSQLT